MTTDTLVDLGLVLVFVLVGGVFAATEIALISLRESRIRELDRRGGRGRRTATLARDPNRFLSAVQIGVTVAGFFSAAYGASTLAPDLAPTLCSSSSVWVPTAWTRPSSRTTIWSASSTVASRCATITTVCWPPTVSRARWNNSSLRLSRLEVGSSSNSELYRELARRQLIGAP